MSIVKRFRNLLSRKDADHPIPDGNPFRYFVYVSQVKTDMLYAQIPKSLVAKFRSSFNVEVGSRWGRITLTKSQQTMLSRLDAVLSYLEEQSLIGAVADSKAYIHGSLDLCVGIPSAVDSSWSFLPLFALWGNQDHHFAMIGSHHHLIGEAPELRCGRAPNLSHLRHILDLVLAVERVESEPRTVSESIGLLRTREDKEYFHNWRYTVKDIADILNRFLVGPPHEYEFVAKVLLMDQPCERLRSFVCTPLFVAIAGR